MFVLDPNIAAEVEVPAEEENILNEVPFSGLHAKLYIADMGWDSRLWTGSANATTGGFGKNVEFLVELKGRKSKIGIDVLLQESKEGQILFRDVLRKITQFTEEPEGNELRKELEFILRLAQKKIIDARCELVVNPINEDEYNITLETSNHLAIPEKVRVQCWPITLAEERYQKEIKQGMKSLNFSSCSLQALTSFLAFDLQIEKGEEKMKSRFVLNLPLRGVPENRPELILQSLLQGRDQVLRYLLLLLQHETTPEMWSTMEAWLRRGPGDKHGREGALHLPLLETMMKTLSRNPSKLDQVNHLIEDLKKTEQGKKLLPDHFDKIWEPIWEMRLRLE
jgi:hypothetical protein